MTLEHREDNGSWTPAPDADLKVTNPWNDLVIPYHAFFWASTCTNCTVAFEGSDHLYIVTGGVGDIQLKTDAAGRALPISRASPYTAAPAASSHATTQTRNHPFIVGKCAGCPAKVQAGKRPAATVCPPPDLHPTMARGRMIVQANAGTSTGKHA